MLLRFRLACLRCFVIALLLTIAVACGGESAQDFEVELFNGERFRLSERYEDNAVVVNFWYPSCAPCREEMPEFQRAWKSLAGEPVSFLGLFVPRGFDTEQTARDFVAELSLTFDFATDRGEAIASAYGIEFYPTTWFIDRDGKVADTHLGTLDAERITDIVSELIED